VVNRDSSLFEPRAVPARLAQADDLLLDTGQRVCRQAMKKRLGPAQLEIADDVHHA
jgi:hypothetical protein